MITIKSEREIKIMREGGKILAKVMEELEKIAKPGVATMDLDRAAEALILKHGAKPAFKGYENFPYSLCVSVNENIVHGYPSEKVILKDGDVVGLDLGILYNGYYADMAITVAVGNCSESEKKIIKIAKQALAVGIKKARLGNTVGDIGSAIQKYVEGEGFSVVRDLCGHGIGKKLHEEPQVFNFGKPYSKIELKEGMTICIEPMITAGNWRLKKSKDGYGFATQDDSLSAHFEHTIAITKNGPQILTKI